MEDLIKKIKKHLENLDNKKFIGNIFIILVLSVVLLVMLNGYTSNDKNKDTTVIKEKSNEYNNLVKDDYESYIEDKLSEILSKLKGVGSVDVMVTLEDSVEKIPASNVTTTREITNELDAQGGTREVSREDETIQVVNTSNDVVVLKEVKPSIKGVIVVAEGAEDVVVLETLYEAVKTVLGVTGNKVQIFPSK
ncbi:MAG: sporulation stage III protein AG [Tissierellaceae bacterium]|nr:sporulation stage III protein AG [Tissierellaceae bacterium]